MLEIGKSYQIRFSQSFFADLTRVDGTRRIVTEPTSLLLLSPEFNVEQQVYVGFKFIDITPSTNVGEAKIVFTFNDDSTLTINETDFTNTRASLVITFKYITGSNETLVPEFDVAVEEIYTGTHGVLKLVNIGSIVTYDGTDYDDQEFEIPMVDDVNDFTIKVDDGYSLVRFTPKLEVRIFRRSPPLIVTNVDITSYVNIEYGIDEVIITIPFILPLNESGVPSSVLTSLPHVIEDLEVSADSLTTYSVDGEVSGVIKTVPYGNDSTTMKLLDTTGQYHFTEQSIEVFRKLIADANVCESIEISFDEDTGGLDVELGIMYDSFTFTDLTREELFMEENPHITYDLENVTAYPQPSQKIYGQIFSTTLTADLGYIIERENVSIIYGDTDVTNEAYNEETGEIRIIGIRKDLAITVKGTLKWSIVFYESQQQEQPLVYTGSKDVQSILFTKENDSYIVKVNGTTLGTLEIPLTEDQTVIGLSLPFSQEVFIPLNVSINNIDIEKYGMGHVLTLYPIIVSTEDPTTFDIELYNMICEKNKVDKTNDISIVSTLTGTLREQCDVMNPVITIETTRLPKFNYVYIPAFRRYFFLNEVTVVSNALYRISLHVDVLMTYRSEIKSQKCMVARNEFYYDVEYEDIQRKKFAGEDVKITDITNADSPFTDHNDELSIILDTMGG